MGGCFACISNGGWVCSRWGRREGWEHEVGWARGVEEVRGDSLMWDEC